MANFLKMLSLNIILWPLQIGMTPTNLEFVTPT